MDQSYATATDLSGKQFRFVKTSAADTVALCGSGERMTGILQNKPDGTIDKNASVREFGDPTPRSKLVVDGNAGAIAAGDLLGSDGNGKGVKVTANNAIYGARAEAASTADGDVIEVTVLQPGYIGA